LFHSFVGFYSTISPGLQLKLLQNYFNSQKQQPQQVWLAVDCWKKVFDMVI